MIIHWVVYSLSAPLVVYSLVVEELFIHWVVHSLSASLGRVFPGGDNLFAQYSLVMYSLMVRAALLTGRVFPGDTIGRVFPDGESIHYVNLASKLLWTENCNT